MGSRALSVIGASVLLLALAACGGNSTDNPVTPTPATADVTIIIAGMNGSQSYSPNPGSMRAGQTVAWRNNDSVPHTATANGGGFNTGNIAAGATSSPITITTAGRLDYHCTIHPSMVGTLNVTQ